LPWFDGVVRDGAMTNLAPGGKRRQPMPRQTMVSYTKWPKLGPLDFHGATPTCMASTCTDRGGSKFSFDPGLTFPIIYHNSESPQSTTHDFVLPFASRNKIY
jgi:hypothetical protein